MKPWVVSFATALIGALLGGFAWSLWTTADHASIEAQRAELTVLQRTLEDREQRVEASQNRLLSQASHLRERLDQALTKADQITASQQSSVERLKRALAVLRELQEELGRQE